MTIYHFTVIVRDAFDSLDNLEDQFFEAGCDDALLCSYNDTIYLEFDREATNAQTAITSAIALNKPRNCASKRKRLALSFGSSAITITLSKNASIGSRNDAN